MHYLDDILTMVAPDTPLCLQNLQVIKGVCQHLGSCEGHLTRSHFRHSPRYSEDGGATSFG